MWTHISETVKRVKGSAQDGIKRIKGFVQDEAFPHGRWSDKTGATAPPCALPLPINEKALSKADDPYWRRNQSWVVLQHITGTRYRVWYATGAGEARRTVFSFSSPLFALRIGPGPLTRVWVEKQNGRFHPPECVEASGMRLRTAKEAMQLSLETKMPIVFL